MSSQMSEDDDFAEECPICGRVLTIGVGRFRTPDHVYCVKCYYERHPPTKEDDNIQHNG